MALAKLFKKELDRNRGKHCCVRSLCLAASVLERVVGQGLDDKHLRAGRSVIVETENNELGLVRDCVLSLSGTRGCLETAIA